MEKDNLVNYGIGEPTHEARVSYDVFGLRDGNGVGSNFYHNVTEAEAREQAKKDGLVKILSTKFISPLELIWRN